MYSTQSGAEVPDCGCGQCDAWSLVVESGRHHNVFSLREWVALVTVFGDLLQHGAADLAVSDYLGPLPDPVERKIRDRVDGEVGGWFDVERGSTIAARLPNHFGRDTYQPASTLELFDEAPKPCCEVVRSALRDQNRNARTLFDKLQPSADAGEGEAAAAQPRCGTGGTGHRRGDGHAPTTANAGPKDCESPAETAENRRLQRSDRVSGSLAVGRNKGAEEVTEVGGIYFSKTWSVALAQARMIEVATEGLTDATHHFFVHAVRSSSAALDKTGGWFPFFNEHIKRALPCNEEERRKSELVWRPLVDAGLLRWRPHSRGDNLAREFKVDEDWMEHFLEAAFQDDDDEPMVNAFTGSPRPEQKRETRLHDANEHKYRGSLLEGLKALKASTRRFNKQAVEDLLVHKKRKVLEARQDVEWEFTQEYREYKQAFFNVHPADRARNGWSGTESFEQWKLLCPFQKRTTEYLRYQKRQKSYMNDLRCYASILRQRPEHVEGEIYEYDTAWEVQQISGRVSEAGGGLQSASKEMKAAAYAGVETHNYDVVGSQLGDVISATEMVPDIDTASLEKQYRAADEPGADPKTENADQLGISRGTYKRLLYATTFVGSWAPDAETALAQANPAVGVPQTLKILRQAAWQEGIDADAAYERAQEHFLPLMKAVRKLADYLLTTYWEEHKYNAGGWVMRNAAGVAFRKSDYEDASTHTKRSKVLAWFLQGAEADKMHRLAARCQEAGIAVMGNEHDGLITASPIPKEIKDEVLKASDLERKPFEEHRVKVDPDADEEELERLQDDIDDVVRGRQKQE